MLSCFCFWLIIFKILGKFYIHNPPAYRNFHLLFLLSYQNLFFRFQCLSKTFSCFFRITAAIAYLPIFHLPLSLFLILLCTSILFFFVLMFFIMFAITPLTCSLKPLFHYSFPLLLIPPTFSSLNFIPYLRTSHSLTISSHSPSFPICFLSYYSHPSQTLLILLPRDHSLSHSEQILTITC